MPQLAKTTKACLKEVLSALYHPIIRQNPPKSRREEKDLLSLRKQINAREDPFFGRSTTESHLHDRFSRIKHSNDPNSTNISI